MVTRTATSTNRESPQLNIPTTIYKDPPKLNLPLDGMSRWSQIAQFSPFCREKFRQLVKTGRAPQSIKFSERCTTYSNRALHRFFADPLNYKVEVVK